MGPRRWPLPEQSLAGRTLHDWGNVAGALRRSLKLLARGDRERARRLLIYSMVSLRVPPAPLPNLGAVLDLILPCPATVAPLVEPADVIVPIHNGAGHLKRLFGSLFNHTDPRHRILLADDGSTDREVAQLLAWAAANRPNVRVLSSVGNRGFIETVNAAMQVTSGHVAILNTDTEVPAGWLERLLQPIATGARIASTTPFSNAASIYGFPIADLDQELPADLGVAEIDAAFARLSPDDQPPLTAPTAIGFCMGINRTAWQSCGAFDAATFGRGYCEETDWCLRAAAAGWRSVLVPNLFVYHAHGGTFARPERRALLEANISALHLRWPDYYRRLTLFRRQDPWASHRAAALLALATSAEARLLVIEEAKGDAGRAAQALAEGRGVVRFGQATGRGLIPVLIERASWRLGLVAKSPNEPERVQRLAQPSGVAGH